MSSRKAKLAVRSSSITSRWLMLVSTSRPRVKRKVCIHVEVADRLRVVVNLHHEVVLGKVLDQRAVLVVHDNWNVDQPRIHAQRGAVEAGAVIGSRRVFVWKQWGCCALKRQGPLQRRRTAVINKAVPGILVIAHH